MMDEKGVIGMPIRLMVAFLIVAMCVPALYYAAENFEEDTDVAEVRQQADRMVAAATSVYYQGKGSSTVVDVDVKPGCELVIDPGGNAYGIQILRGGEVADTVYSQRPPIEFIGDPIDVTGSASLRISCEGGDGAYGVRVTFA